jgi:Protein of unknown function (DUF3551)
MNVISTPVDFVGINVYLPGGYVSAPDAAPGFVSVPFPAKHPTMKFGISKEWVRLHYRSNKRPTSRTAMGAMAMLSLLLTMAGSAQAEGSWCLNKGGTGSTNCGYYSYQQCMASVSGGTSFCTQNGFYQNYPARRTLRR